MYVPESHAPSSGFLLHRGKAAFIRIRAPSQHDLFARLGVKHRVGLGAAAGKQA
jgi:hypothetical protein